MKSIYILLSRTRTVLSRLIHAATGDGFTHVSIGLDSHLTELFSFARRHSLTPLPAGLVQENLHTAVFARNGKSHCALYKIDVTDEQYDMVRAKVDAMLHERKAYKYSILGLFLCKLDFVHERQQHLFCSQFVAKLLEEIDTVQLPKHPSLMRPIDFASMQGLKRCYEGPLHACAHWWMASPKPALDRPALQHLYSTGR